MAPAELTLFVECDVRDALAALAVGDTEMAVVCLYAALLRLCGELPDDDTLSPLPVGASSPACRPVSAAGLRPPHRGPAAVTPFPSAAAGEA